MLRRLGMIATTAVAGLGLSIGTAHALSAATTLCVRTSRAAFRSCQVRCKADFQGVLPGCFGPGSTCAAKCQTDQNGCGDRVADVRASCQDDCIDKRDNAIALCRDRDLTDTAAEASCITAARADAVICRQVCRDAAVEPQRACTVIANGCLESCASIPPGAQ